MKLWQRVRLLSILIASPAIVPSTETEAYRQLKRIVDRPFGTARSSTEVLRTGTPHSGGLSQRQCEREPGKVSNSLPREQSDTA